MAKGAVRWAEVPSCRSPTVLGGSRYPCPAMSGTAVTEEGSTGTPDEGPLDLRLLPSGAAVGEDGRLSVAGLDLVELAEQFGTPLFVYDEAHLRARCRQARAAWGDGVAYATKAFLCRAMAALAHEEGMCLDVSTAGELHVALTAGVPAERLVLHGNNKSHEELRRAVEVGVGRIVVDSFDEIDRLAALLSHPEVAGGRRPAVLVRVTPGVEAHTHDPWLMQGADKREGEPVVEGVQREPEHAQSRCRDDEGDDEAPERLGEGPFPGDLRFDRLRHTGSLRPSHAAVADPAETGRPPRPLASRCRPRSRVDNRPIPRSRYRSGALLPPFRRSAGNTE